MDRIQGSHKQIVQYLRARNSGAPYHDTTQRERDLCGGDLLTVAEIFQLGDPEESELREYTSKHRSAD